MAADGLVADPRIRAASLLVVLLAGVAGLAPVPAGRGSVEAPALGPSPGKGAAPALSGVTLWVPARGGYLNDWRRAAERASSSGAAPRIRVAPMWADYWATLTLSLAEGNAPPLVVVDPDIAARLASRGWLADVSALAARRNLEVLRGAFAWEGRTFAVPGFADPALLYLNVDRLGRAGVDPSAYPWTWESLREAARRVAEPASGMWGFPVNGWPPLELFVWQAGGWVVEPPGRLWEDPGPLWQAASFYRGFVREGLSPAPPASWQQTLDAYYRAGRAGMMIGLYSDPLDRPERLTVPFQSRPARLPVGPSGQPVGWVWGEGVAASVPASAEALAALAALATALEELGPLPPTARRAGADAVALAELEAARAPAGLARRLEFSAAWWEHVVAPLLSQPEPLDVARLLEQARSHLAGALR